MAMIVTTMLWLPAGVLVGAACYLAFGISPHAFVTFGGTFSGPVGMAAWWLLGLLPASVYAILASE